MRRNNCGRANPLAAPFAACGPREVVPNEARSIRAAVGIVAGLEPVSRELPPRRAVVAPFIASRRVAIAGIFRFSQCASLGYFQVKAFQSRRYIYT